MDNHPIPPNDENSPFLEGYKAFWVGEKVNPYPSDGVSSDGYHWLRGWYYAEIEQEERQRR